VQLQLANKRIIQPVTPTNITMGTWSSNSHCIQVQHDQGDKEHWLPPNQMLSLLTQMPHLAPLLCR